MLKEFRATGNPKPQRGIEKQRPGKSSCVPSGCSSGTRDNWGRNSESQSLVTARSFCEADCAGEFERVDTSIEAALNCYLALLLRRIRLCGPSRFELAMALRARVIETKKEIPPPPTSSPENHGR